MSLIKEALDKAQQEGDQPPEGEEPTPEELPGDPGTPVEGSGEEGTGPREISLSMVLASVVIVILAALIGGQFVLLAAMFLF